MSCRKDVSLLISIAQLNIIHQYGGLDGLPHLLCCPVRFHWSGWSSSDGDGMTSG